MKIAAVTLNPAIDQTVRVDQFAPNQVNRGQSMQFDPGGKGVNVASFLTDYGLDVAVTGFLGAENPRLFEQLFAQKKIADHFVRIPGRTRTNVKIVDEARQETTDINMQGEAPSPEAIGRLYETVEKLAETCDWFVLAGNLPPQAPVEIYAMLVAQIKARGRFVALDTSREALRHGVLAGPTLVKPNIHELEQLVGEKLAGETAVIHAARQLFSHDIKTVIISMGAAGALFLTKNEAVKAIPPRVSVKSTVGAGDAMVAGAIAGAIAAHSLADQARLATAFSLCAITTVGPHLPETAVLQSFVRQVSLETV